ncbi:MAG: hypothetical protein ACK2VA_20050 [Anaerolineae bacterium]
MNKPLGCLSAYGLLASLVLIVGVGIAIYLQGAALFSPGPLTARASQAQSLQGYTSHAEMERACTLCHRLWGRVEPARCLSCHATVGAEVAAQNGIHGWLEDAATCIDCHPDHQGREADVARARLALFPHERAGFTLRQHPPSAEGKLFSCENCHAADYALAPSTCASCHEEMDATFVPQHTVSYGTNCLSCHDGGPLPESFDHQAIYPLDGAHVQLECSACHDGLSFGKRINGCIDCHQEPEIHGAQFGTECGACHTAQGWQPARLRYHTFPLDHGQAEPESCATCHPAGYAVYTCDDCHVHPPAEIETQHLERGITELEDCARCHPAGRVE